MIISNAVYGRDDTPFVPNFNHIFIQSNIFGVMHSKKLIVKTCVFQFNLTMTEYAIIP